MTKVKIYGTNAPLFIFINKKLNWSQQWPHFLLLENKIIIFFFNNIIFVFSLYQRGNLYKFCKSFFFFFVIYLFSLKLNSDVIDPMIYYKFYMSQLQYQEQKNSKIYSKILFRVFELKSIWIKVNFKKLHLQQVLIRH